MGEEMTAMIRIPGFHRINDLVYLFRDLGLKKGAEIGVADGQFSLALCEGIPGLSLICVDSWRDYGSNPWSRNQQENDAAYNLATKRMAPYNARFIRKFSMDAVQEIPLESLDFVYIDGNHSYKHVSQDIREWAKRVRPGGMVSGHDYYRFRRAGVMPAVDEYVLANNIEKVYLADEKESSFWWTKP